MPVGDSFLDISRINPELHRGRFQYPSKTGQILEFHHIAEWRDFLDTCRIHSRRVPVECADQFHVALRIMLFAWADGFLIKAAELMALRALESSLQEVYYQALDAANPVRKKPKPQGTIIDNGPRRFGLAKCLEYGEQHDGLSAVYEFSKFKDNVNALHRIRNGLAHGDMSPNMPWGGLLETVRDIIEHAFRNCPERSALLEQMADSYFEENFAGEFNDW